MSDPTDPASAHVGFIGLGNIGKPMARRLVDWRGGLTVCDVDPAPTRSFAERGAHVAATPAEVAERAAVISIVVRDDAQVLEVLDGPNGILRTARPGTVVAVHSTVEADTPARLAAIAAEHDVHLVDAPVSGGVAGASTGTLALMVGGTAEAVALIREPFAPFATLIAHFGPIGSGTIAKLARNLITFSAIVAVGEATELASASDIDVGLLGEVVRHSDRIIGGPGSVMLRTSSDPLDPADGLHPVFSHTRDLGEKDLRLAIELAADLGIDLPMADLSLERLGAALGVPHPATTQEDGS